MMKNGLPRRLSYGSLSQAAVKPQAHNQTSTTVYSLHFGSNYANSGARAVYDQIVAMLREHNNIPSFMSGGKNDITKELAYKDGKYSIILTDSNKMIVADKESFIKAISSEV